MSVRTGSIKLLRDTPVSELAITSRGLVYINTKATVDDALCLLKRQNILSLPVYDEERKAFIGIAHIADIMRYVVFFDFKGDQIAESFQNGTMPCAELIGLDKESQETWVTCITDNLDNLLEYFSKGVHRVLVRIPVDRTQHISMEELCESSTDDLNSQFKIVTQSDLLQYILRHVNEVKREAQLIDRTLKELQLVKGVSTITESETALSGFAKMSKEDLSSLAIVSKEGVLLGTLSSSDLRGLSSNLIHRVLLPVIDFIKESHRGFLPNPVWVQEGHTLYEAMTKMVLARVHRVWIADAVTFNPIGVVTMSDVLSKLYNNEDVLPLKPAVL